MNKIVVKNSMFTGSGYCTNPNCGCDLQCERCKFNKPKEEVEVKV